MSLTTTPNFNDYIIRIYDILTRSALLFPNSIGGDTSKDDLVNQIIKYELPIPEQPMEGPGPPHIFITKSATPLLERKQVGRDSRDAQGPERQLLEFYIVIVVHGPELRDSEAQMENIISAVTTTLNQNKRLTDINNANPLSATSQYMVVPYLLNSEQRSLLANNVLFRPSVYINLR